MSEDKNFPFHKQKFQYYSQNLAKTFLFRKAKFLNFVLKCSLCVKIVQISTLRAENFVKYRSNKINNEDMKNLLLQIKI